MPSDGSAGCGAAAAFGDGPTVGNSTHEQLSDPLARMFTSLIILAINFITWLEPGADPGACQLTVGLTRVQGSLHSINASSFDSLPVRKAILVEPPGRPGELGAKLNP